MQDIHNRLFLTVTDIQENLTDTLADLRQQELDTEQSRLDALADLHQDTAERITDIEQRALDARADSRRDHFESVEDIQNRLARRQFGVVSADELTAQQTEQLRESQDFRTAIFDLRQGERREDASIEQRRTDSLATVESDQAARAIEINERIATVLENIATQQTDAQTSAAGAISEAEAGSRYHLCRRTGSLCPCC